MAFSCGFGFKLFVVFALIPVLMQFVVCFDLMLILLIFFGYVNLVLQLFCLS